LWGGHDDGAAAVADHAAVKAAHRVGDDRRLHDFLEADGLAVHGVGVVAGVLGGGNADPRDLLERGAELVHVTLHHHAVLGRDRVAIRRFPGHVGAIHFAIARGGAGGHAFALRTAR